MDRNKIIYKFVETNFKLKSEYVLFRCTSPVTYAVVSKRIIDQTFKKFHSNPHYRFSLNHARTKTIYYVRFANLIVGWVPADLSLTNYN